MGGPGDGWEDGAPALARIHRPRGAPAAVPRGVAVAAVPGCTAKSWISC